MYSAKMAGRNRTNCLEPVPEEASEPPSWLCSPQVGTTELLVAPL
jgi:hypothetical protein